MASGLAFSGRSRPIVVPLLLKAKPPEFLRIVDPNRGVRDTRFDQLRLSVLDAQAFRCAGCGFASMPDPPTAQHPSSNPTGSMEIHHLDDNHANNDRANLAAICPLCHTLLHIGFSSVVDADQKPSEHAPGWIVSLPGISQRQLIHIVRTIGVALVLRKDSPAQKQSDPLADMAYEAWERIKERTSDTQSMMLGYSGDIRVMSAWLQVGNRPKVERLSSMTDIMFLPNIEAFFEPFEYWAHVVYPQRLPIESWSGVLDEFIKLMAGSTQV